MTDTVENNTTTTAETITVFHGSSSFFDTPDLDKEETNVHGSGFYTTLNEKEAYNYAYANAGQNAQKDSEKNAIYRMEISKEGMYNGYSLVDADLLKKLKDAGLDMGIKDYKGRTVADMVAERKSENTRVNETSEQTKLNEPSMTSLALSKSGKPLKRISSYRIIKDK